MTGPALSGVSEDWKKKDIGLKKNENLSVACIFQQQGTLLKKYYLACKQYIRDVTTFGMNI